MVKMVWMVLPVRMANRDLPEIMAETVLTESKVLLVLMVRMVEMALTERTVQTDSLAKMESLGLPERTA